MLSRRNDIVIKSADKGSGTRVARERPILISLDFPSPFPFLAPTTQAIMDRNWHINECLRQLNDTKFYKLLDNDITTDIQKRILKYTERMNRDTIINEEN